MHPPDELRSFYTGFLVYNKSIVHYTSQKSEIWWTLSYP